LRLSSFIERAQLLRPLPADAWDLDVQGLTLDSRQVKPGDLFAALPGSRVDGVAFAPAAIQAGAAAVLGGAALAEYNLPVPALIARDPQALLAQAAARFFGPQPAHVAAVTGTNGKTSVASFTRQLWALSGLPAASIGTLGLQSSTGDLPGNLTTPDVLTIQRLAAELATKGVDHLVIEASSHGLEQKRVDGLTVSAAAFTNLTRDHLDHHVTMEAYFAAKARLFSEVLSPRGVAVLNADVPEFSRLQECCRRRDITVLDFGRTARLLRLVEQVPAAAGQVLTLAIDDRRHQVVSPLVGAFQAENLLAALGLWHASGGALSDGIRLLEKVQGAPGRMQLAGTTRRGAAVYVDYAHTPDALQKALQAARPHASNRLLVVFGCGGDRDTGKRPLMGKVAAQLADLAIVTDDNPRSEDPAVIRRAVLVGMPPGTREIGDRAEAIRAAVGGLQEGDVLLIAGKGHEQGQTIGRVVHPFDDVAVAASAITESALA
jgi:UDP-N-acetylmuramoyl-L-alanyl-D-glutamate--2,6-diaminopimelate ligase